MSLPGKEKNKKKTICRIYMGYLQIIEIFATEGSKIKIEPRVLELKTNRKALLADVNNCAFTLGFLSKRICFCSQIIKFSVFEKKKKTHSIGFQNKKFELLMVNNFCLYLNQFHRNWPPHLISI